MEHSVLNEYGVIGSLLLDASLMPEASVLTEDDFSFLPLREIFRAMRRQYAENGTFDALTIRGEAGKICADVTDGLLMQTLEITPTAANLPAYVSEVKSESLSRKLQELAGGLLDAEQDPETALAHAQDIIGTLSREQGAGIPWNSETPWMACGAEWKNRQTERPRALHPASRSTTNCWAADLSAGDCTSSGHVRRWENPPSHCRSP